VARGGSVDSILQFRLERGGDGMKLMKRRQQAHLGSTGRKHDTARRCGDVGQRRRGTMEGKGGRRRQLSDGESDQG
jgi:hypothetical protein